MAPGRGHRKGVRLSHSTVGAAYLGVVKGATSLPRSTQFSHCPPTQHLPHVTWSPPQSPPSSLVFYSFIASKSPSPGLSPHPVSLLTASPRILWFLNTHRHRHSLALHLLPASCLLPICVRPLPSHMQRAPHPYNHPCTPSPYQSPGTGKGCPDAVCLSRG